MDRLHTLPMSPTFILVGRSLSDLLAAVICSTIVALTGLAIYWRTSTSLVEVLAGFGIVLLFSYAFHWMASCLGLAVAGPESAEGIAFIEMIPLAFVSNVLVPAQGMPARLRTIAIWNPVSAVASACRELFGNPNPSALLHAWPMQHPTAASLIRSLAILAVSVPLAGRLYRRRTRR
jgi:ABC-2 type transport system permease protein